jgi:DNA-directed RNA polymerase subunit M/transcription elongation factor TFIIS
MKILRFCPKCKYLLSLKADAPVSLNCPNCGFTERFEPKTAEEALILETQFRSGSSAGGAASGISINAYTLMDPTLPHVTTIPCPNATCASAADATRRDVIYIKTDPRNMKFQYVCAVAGCGATWTSA